MPLYFDNAGTSFPKAPGVGSAMAGYIDRVGANVGRGDYASARDAGDTLMRVRERLCRMFGFEGPANVIFTGGMTAALNTVIKGFPLNGGHVVVGSLEHNAVMRPLTQIGAPFSRIPCDEYGALDVDAARALIREDTRLMVLCHASNVCGTLAPVEELSALCRERGIPLVLDAAQTAGHYPVDFRALGLSALCIPAHKGMLGPQGLGVIMMTKEFAAALDPLITGGTGSMSESEDIPPFLPDRFEAGTLPIPNIYGLDAALDFIEHTGVETLCAREEALTARLTAGLTKLPVRLVGRPDAVGRVGVVSVDCTGRDNGEVARRLAEEHGVLVRSGLMCAPSAHRALGTFPGGTVRLSVGYATTDADVDAAIRALSDILSQG